MPETLSLGGREYRHAGSMPIRQDIFLMMHARHAGLAGVVRHDGEEAGAYAERLLDACITSGRAMWLLGTLLLPANAKAEDWTEEMAYQTSAHLGSIMDPTEKTRVYSELVSVLLGFFVNGLGSWIASPRSSDAENRRPSKTSIPDTESGPDSSEPSPAMTTTSPSES